MRPGKETRKPKKETKKPAVSVAAPSKIEPARITRPKKDK